MAKYKFVDESLDVLANLVNEPDYNGPDLTELFRLFDRNSYDGHYLNALNSNYSIYTETMAECFGLGTKKPHSEIINTLWGEITLKVENSFGDKKITITGAKELSGSLEHIDKNATSIKLEIADKGKLEILLNGGNVEITEVAPNGENKTIKMAIPIDNAGSDAVETPTKKLQPLFGGLFRQGTSNLLYSEAKVGKTTLAFEIAKADSIRHPVFVLLEDYDNIQEILCEKMVGKKAAIFGVNTAWEERTKKVKALMEQEADNDAGFAWLFPKAQEWKDLLQKTYHKKGLKDDTEKVFDNLLVLETIIRDAIKKKVDFICIDCLNALLKNLSKLDRTVLERIINPIVQENITLLVLHHTNARGKIAGNQENVNSFACTCHLKIEERNETEDILILDEDYVRYGRPHSLTIRRPAPVNENDAPIFEIGESVIYNSNKPKKSSPTLYEVAETLVENWPHDFISFLDFKAELVKTFPDVGDTSLKNYLLKLLNNGLVEKTDGKWATIKIVKTS
ncbi:hypothetical protein AGMMS49579_17610 [Spirochaetia bacterium]|nr:hypothetical protein AGMMS49579_17610 [Spirochaetia bacterium]